MKISRFFLLLAVLFIPFYFFRFYPFGIGTNIFEIAVLAAFVAVVHHLITTRKTPVFGSVWPYLFLAASLRGLILAADRVNALGVFKGWFLVPIVLYWLIINVFDGKSFKTLLWPLLVSMEIVSLWAFLQRLGFVHLLFYQTGDPASFAQYLSGSSIRAFGPFESPNYLAMFLVPALFLILPAVASIKSRVAKVAIVIFPLLAIYFSGSRGGLLALLLAGVIAALWQTFKPKRVIASHRVSGYFLAVATLIVVAAISILAIRQVSNNPTSGGDDVRRDIYHYSLKMVQSSPVNGIGLGQFYAQIDRASLTDGSFRTHGLPYALHPHNLFLALWLNIGIFGLIFFVAIVFLDLAAIQSLTGVVRFALLGALLAILIHGAFDTTYFKNDLSALFWFACALIFLKANDKSSSQN